MKTLNTYVTRGFLLAFLMSIGILTFGMTGANLVKVLEFVSQGISFFTFVEFTYLIMPVMLTFTVPWAVMVAVMLVFGRLSADNEITAMRACGISILQIVSPILIITFLLTLGCLYLQLEAGPPLLKKARGLMSKAVIDQPLALFEPGKQISFENTIIYINDKDEANNLKGVTLYTLVDPRTTGQCITAETGKITVDKEKQVLTIHLKDCLVEDKKNEKNNAVNRFYSQNLEFNFFYGRRANSERLSTRPKHMRLNDLLGRITLTKQLGHKTTDLEVELNKRVAFALSPIAFLLLGLPLAIRTSRRETSVGLFLSVILAGVFYLCIILCESLSSVHYIYPQYLLWLPNIIFQVFGAYLTLKISRR